MPQYAMQDIARAVIDYYLLGKMPVPKKPPALPNEPKSGD